MEKVRQKSSRKSMKHWEITQTNFWATHYITIFDSEENDWRAFLELW